MRAPRVVVVGAGVGGLVAALLLAARGLAVTVVERAGRPGGKMRTTEVGAHRSMPARPYSRCAGCSRRSSRRPGHRSPTISCSVLPRYWRGTPGARTSGSICSPTSIAQPMQSDGFAGATEARGYRDFCARAQRIYRVARSGRSSARSDRVCETLVAAFGFCGLGDLWQIRPFVSMWRTLDEHFRDPRLRQLFGRYATYCGSSPFLAPATLMLVAHVEREGVWLVEGGMHRVARALADLAVANGAMFRYATEARAVIRAGRTSRRRDAGRSASTSTPTRSSSMPTLPPSATD